MDSFHLGGSCSKPLIWPKCPSFGRPSLLSQWKALTMLSNSSSNNLWRPTVCKTMLRARCVLCILLNLSIWPVINNCKYISRTRKKWKRFWLISFVKDENLILNLFQPVSVQNRSHLSLNVLSTSPPVKISTSFSWNKAYFSQVFPCYR